MHPANKGGGKLSQWGIEYPWIDRVWRKCLDEVIRAPCPHVNGVVILVSYSSLSNELCFKHTVALFN